ncbi:ATP-dependent sacrificial sulfur transferase LarE [Thermostichus vulcanus]|uniref:ATP-dependent sacrificial sulfur transferase LarE n=1 Tax=Thermostichus vulcanus str. 'Rupite' TaxID=2813851 RepID=A0ABT0C7D0_THEVL|nr:ATP-dependent sacrificial sulfur transferase LarE [Thermostichus vulcanus]MCJ2541695.1 ATP-dependent sacrificial sulfur transferase LarE [Thermostichus vulcanus str. 'Rupite']
MNSPQARFAPSLDSLDPVLRKKFAQVTQIFAEMEQVLVAYSGGVDSTLVAKLAWDQLGERALAVTAASPSLLPEDLEEAIEQAQVIGIRHEIVETHELEDPNYAANPINRCYFCKRELHDTLRPLAQSRGYDYVVDGLNADDLSDYRPGVQAAVERGVRSPLAEVGIRKLEVRQLSRQLGLPWWDKPAQPCLSSRFPYGEEITAEKLRRVGAAERYLRSLGWRQVRVRSEKDTARIELPPQQIHEFIQKTDLEALVKAFQAAGYLYVSLDLEGYQSGKLNRVLNSV